MSSKAEQRAETSAVEQDTVGDTLSLEERAELRARSARVDDAYARGECTDADVVLAELDQLLFSE